MLSNKEIFETIDMVEKEHLDVRTITMGISLVPCIRESAEKTAAACYDRICSYAENIVNVGAALEKEYGIPIVNKRVSITPASLLRILRGKKPCSQKSWTRRRKTSAWTSSAAIPRSCRRA